MHDFHDDSREMHEENTEHDWWLRPVWYASLVLCAYSLLEIVL